MAFVADTQRSKRIGHINCYILNRISDNKNFIACVTGETGSGKSYAGLKEGEILDSEFNIDNVCFTPEEFMDLVNEKTKKLHKGSVIVYDEMQVTMSSLDFQKLTSKLINYVLQTFRYMGFILFITTPHKMMLNSQVRRLLHSHWITVAVNKKEKYSTLKPFLIQINQHNGEPYNKYLKVVTRAGTFKHKRLELGLPSKKLFEEYEDKRTKWSRQMNEDISLELNKSKKKEDNELEQWVRAVDIAKKLSIHETTMLSWIKSGKVNAKKQGRVWLISKKDAESILYNPFSLENQSNQSNMFNQSNQQPI